MSWYSESSAASRFGSRRTALWDSYEPGAGI
jgi:hypothetical protein